MFAMFAPELGGFILVLLICVFLPFCLALFAFWIWMLVDAIQNKGLTDGEKIGWVLAIALLHILAALLYFFIGRPKRNHPLLPPPPVIPPWQKPA